MATYTELRNLMDDASLRNRVAVACIVKANAIGLDGAATAEQQGWAQRAISSPEGEARRAVMIAIAQNKDSTVAQIIGASDAVLQTAVDTAVGILSKGLTVGA